MHDLHMAQAVLDTALDAGRKAGAQRITSVRVKVGDLSTFDPASLRVCFDSLKKNTIASEADLDVETVPPSSTCRVCNDSFSPKESASQCPACGSTEVEISGGRGVQVDSVEFV